MSVLERLLAFAKSGAHDETRFLASIHGQSLQSALDFVESRQHMLAFLGSVGVGKSSLIGTVTDLFVGDRPTTRTALKDNSILAIGSGRTTVCEVRIRSSREGDGGAIGLEVEPLPRASTEREIKLYAEDEWIRKQHDTRRPTEEDSDPTSLEVQRAIRCMTNYVERQETYVDGNLRRKRNVWPLDEVIPSFASAKDLAEHLIERAKLDDRTETSFWWPTHEPRDLNALKDCFENINRGLTSTVMLPKSMTVVVPTPLPGLTADLELTVIDTRGLDGNVPARGDILDFLRNPRAVNVICGAFKSAPDDTVRALLRVAASTVDTQKALKYAILVLIDQSDAEQVNGADGDRDFGQQLKIDECVTALEGAGLSGWLKREQILAFDALNDDRLRLVDKINDGFHKLRADAETDLEGLVRNAEEFLHGTDNELLPELRSKIDNRIKAVMTAHPLAGAPLVDPLEGIYEAIRECRYASVVWAACRRNGYYSKLDLYAAVETKATHAAEQWLGEFSSALIIELNKMQWQEEEFRFVQDHIRLRQRQIEDGKSRFYRTYAERVHAQVEEQLGEDPIWETCSAEWRQGSGFKSRVIGHLESFSRRQQNLTAHESTPLVDFLPLYDEAMRSAQAPKFTLHVRNLRALRFVNFQPDQVCALIGANGTGKTTLLEVFRLLRLTYERGLAEAVSIVFKGGGNLRSWGTSDDEPIEIGVELGDIYWMIQLIPRDGSVADVTHERLSERGHVIFERDSLGGFTFRNERIEAGRYIGLRALMDRGAPEFSIRRVAKLLQSIHVHGDPDLVSLRDGSRTMDDRDLLPRGTNALTMLRKWHQERDNRYRYDFVLEGLDAAFPNRVSDLEFREAGNNLVANIYRPDVETLSPLADEANGVLQMLVLLCQVAATNDQSLLAIDEPENGLHPYALGAFFRRTSQWARYHNVTVLLATHSTVLLNRFTAEPEQVYVMKSKDPGGPMPTKLDVLYDRSWIESYVLGDLQEQGELGSNKDAV